MVVRLSSMVPVSACIAAAVPSNPTKSKEYAPADAAHPPEGAHLELPTATTGASTLSEENASAKTGAQAEEPQTLDGSLAAKRVNSADQRLTNRHGHDFTGAADFVAFFDLLIFAEQNGSHLVFFQVESDAGDAVRELHHLARHHVFKPVFTGLKT